MTYRCSKCKFVVKKDSLPNRCPYCSAEGTIEKEQTAQDLLNDVFDEMDDIDFSKQERDESEFKM